ncbi:hypothetical protein SAVIM338S_01393 [Streptomyces avidinii]
MEATRTPADWGTGRSSHGGLRSRRGEGLWRECEPAARGRQAFGQQPLFRRATTFRGSRYRTATTADPCPNSPWFAVIPARAPGTCRSPAVPRSCHVSSQTCAMA